MKNLIDEWSKMALAGKQLAEQAQQIVVEKKILPILATKCDWEILNV